MSSSEAVLGDYNVWINISWGGMIPLQIADKTVGLQKIKYKKGIPAWMLISESRLILISEFKGQTKFMYVLPLNRKKNHSLYMELALGKLHRYSFGTSKNYIEFEPHGQVGKTRIEFKSLSSIQKLRIQQTLEKAKALNKQAPEAGIIISGKPVEEVFTERTGLTSMRETIQALRSPMRFEQQTPLSQQKTQEVLEPAKTDISPKETVCPNCGTRFTEKYAFCPLCGTRIQRRRKVKKT
nr:zinc ribbon domain-containing protein [Candidatus Freyarchaeota archaeon]